MAKRGRKSAAELSVVSVSLQGDRPPAPAELTAQEAEVWSEIVESIPGGWISRAQEPLLAAYCRHVSAADRLSIMIDHFKPDLEEPGALQRFAKLLSMRERETKALSSLATRMRLTQQSQMHPRTAARAMSDAGGHAKLWERKAPWEDV